MTTKKSIKQFIEKYIWYYNNPEDSYRIQLRILGLKLTLRKKNYSAGELAELNKPYEDGTNKNIPVVINRHQALEELLNSEKSLARFGDGEFNLIFGNDLPFQEYSKELADKLAKILKSDDKNIMIGITDVFGSLAHNVPDAVNFWRNYLVCNRERIYKLLDFNKQYYDTEMTRPYINASDKSYCGEYFKKFKKVWQDKNVVFVEGKASRLGYNNDLFDNVSSAKRILCPPKNAWSKYGEILNRCKNFPKDTLFIIALGPTATALAYDLSKLGYRALDLGHIDIEYEWFLMKATEKVAVKNKYVNEVKKGGRVITEIHDDRYMNEIYANLAD